MALAIGTKAPDFNADSNNGSVSLNDFSGKWIVLYFYPKDNTSGCTREACDFRDNMERITSAGAVVLGVSPDSVKSHVGFIAKQNLNFTLIADPDKTICNAFDVMGEKSMYGKKYMGVIRSTFIIDGNGVIQEVYSNVKVDGHVDAVISRLEELKNQ